MFVTVLPKPDTNYYCSPKLNHTITFLGNLIYLPFSVFLSRSPSLSVSKSLSQSFIQPLNQLYYYFSPKLKHTITFIGNLT